MTYLRATVLTVLKLWLTWEPLFWLKTGVSWLYWPPHMAPESGFSGQSTHFVSIYVSSCHQLIASLSWNMLYLLGSSSGFCLYALNSITVLTSDCYCFSNSCKCYITSIIQRTLSYDTLQHLILDVKYHK